MNPRSLLDQLAAAAGMNFVSALRELIDNCLDADARSVAITYGDNTFSIEDDGRGASDPGVIVTPNVHAEHATTRSGRYGIGGSTALAWLSEATGIVWVDTKTTAHHHMLELKYADAADVGALNCKCRAAANRTRKTGTKIQVAGVRRLNSQHIGSARRELSQTYAPALRAGVSINLNGSPLSPFVPPAVAKSKRFAFEVADHHVKGFVALTKPGERNPLKGWTIAYGHRFVCTKSDPAADHDIDLSRIYSEVELPRDWPWINTHKDDFTEPQEELMAKLAEASLWAINQVKTEGRSIELTSALKSAQAILDAALDVPPVRGRRPGPRGQQEGTKEPTGQGSPHERFSATQPGDRKARGGPRRIQIQPTSDLGHPYEIRAGARNVLFVLVDVDDEGNRKYFTEAGGGYLADLILAWIAGDWVCRSHQYKPMFPDIEAAEIPEIFDSLRAIIPKEAA